MGIDVLCTSCTSDTDHFPKLCSSNPTFSSCDCSKGAARFGTGQDSAEMSGRSTREDVEMQGKG